MSLKPLMRGLNQTFFTESVDWIRDNPRATIHDVPDHLMRIWTFEVDEPRAPIGFHLSVFSFGYFQRQFLKGGLIPGQKMRVSSDKLFELYEMWQMKLGLAAVHRQTDMRIGALELFDFPRDERIEVCRFVQN